MGNNCAPVRSLTPLSGPASPQRSTFAAAANIVQPELPGAQVPNPPIVAGGRGPLDHRLDRGADFRRVWRWAEAA